MVATVGVILMICWWQGRGTADGDDYNDDDNNKRAAGRPVLSPKADPIKEADSYILGKHQCDLWLWLGCS